MISQKEITTTREQLTGKSRKELPKPKANNNRHVSVLYGMQYFTRVPIVKRSRKTEKDCFGNIDKQEIFSLVHGFANKLLQDEQCLQKVIQQTKFDENQLQTKIMSTEKSINSKKILLKENFQEMNKFEDMVSINIIEVNGKGSFDDFGMMGKKPFGNKTNLNVNNNNTNKGKNNDRKPKISIMLEGDNFDFAHNMSSQQFSSALFSDQTLPPGLSSIDICQQQLTMKMIELIYEQPQPFLINLSVCLMLKYLHCSKTKLTKKNVCWILSVGTIIAYKIYYDEPVQGLVESFAYILKLSKEDIITLERHFLAQIDHQAVISNQQYHSTLYQIIKHGGQ